MSNFSEMLTAKRKEKKMLKKEVAELFGWTPMYYGRFEAGRLKPSPYNYEKFSKFLEISENDLIKIVNEDD